jgi:outer membrane protein assembly factor BamC
MTALVIATTLVCITSGCSSLEEDKINYKSASKQLPTLEVPPDLTQIKRDSRYQINGATSASSLAAANAGTTRTANDSGTAINQVGEAKI